MPLPAFGSVSTVGNLHETDTRWNRRRQACTPLDPNLNHSFDVHFFTAGATDTYRFRADWDDSDALIDGFLHAFLANDTFDRTNPNLGTDGDGFPCLAGNDDFGAVDVSQLDVFLISGETVAIIASSTFAAEDIGPYLLTASLTP